MLSNQLVPALEMRENFFFATKSAAVLLFSSWVSKSWIAAALLHLNGKFKKRRKNPQEKETSVSV